MAMGRREKPIDWELVDNLIMAQCTAKEISSHFNIDPTNFYDRIVDKHGENFTTYASRLYCKGKSLLKAKQYNQAYKEGNTKMLIKLGDIYLDEFKKVNKELANPMSIETLLENVSGTSKDLVNDTI